MITVECTPGIVPCIYLIICRFSSFECRKISASLSLMREVDWRKPRLWGEKIKKKISSFGCRFVFARLSLTREVAKVVDF